MEGMSLRLNSIAIGHHPRQCEQMPAISITGLLWRKTRRARRGFERFGGTATRRLADGAAAFADQKDDEIIAAVVMDASHESVASLDAVDETVLAQEFERAIDGDRGRAGPLPQPAHDLVGTERLMARQQSLQDLPPHRGEPLRARGALRFRMRDGGAGATAVS